jgi:hypothetical protein
MRTMTVDLRWRHVAVARMKSFGRQPKQGPIVVLGNQKSGTTAIGALLAIHLEKPVTLDMPALWYEIDKILRGQRPLRSFVHRYACYFNGGVVKEPWLTFAFSELRTIFPAGKYVLVLRDPRDNIRSMLDRLSMPGHLEANPPALGALPTGWRQAFDPSLLGCACEHYVDVLAERWNRAASLPKCPGGDALVVARYEDFVRDKMGFIADLADRLGERGHADISEHVDRRFQPRGQLREVGWQDFFGKQNLARIESRCRTLMEAYRYQSVEGPS